MSLIRSLTTRRIKVEEISTDYMGPAASQRNGKPVHRAQISSPVALVSSTNSLSYDAPDIVGTKPIRHRGNRLASLGSSTISSSRSEEESDASSLSISSNTDASSVDDAPSPVTPPEAEPNHLSCYFKPAVNTKSGATSPSESTRPSLDAPTIPQRVPSHSKKAHENVHRKRSVQRMITPPHSISKRGSADMFKSIETPLDNPFGSELAQLDQIAEELSQTVRDASTDADVVFMESHGLAIYGASDYLDEIHALIYDVFLAEEPSWI